MRGDERVGDKRGKANGGCKVKKNDKEEGNRNVIHKLKKKKITISIFVTPNLSFQTERGNDTLQWK